MIRRPPRSPLFPYPPPFRSRTRRVPPRLSRLATDVRGGGDAAGDPRAERGDLERRGLRSEEHTSELQSPCNLVCRLLLEKKKSRARTSRDPTTLLASVYVSR